MGYSNVAGDLNVYGTTTLSSLRMNGPINAQGITSTGISNFQNVFASNLTVTNAFIITATNTSVTNALSIVNQGTSTALYVNQNEFPNMVYNVAEFWDHTQLAMVIDGYGNVAVHTASSPGFAFTVVDGASIDKLTLGTPLAISSGGTGTSSGAVQNSVFAGPLFGTGAPLFRSLVSADLPSYVTVSNIAANGAALSSIIGSNVTGNVANATLALVVSQAAQPNITSVGLLSNLAVSNSMTTTNIFANTLTLANASSTINVLGNVTATTFYGAVAGSNVGTFSNLYSANALTTTNIIATTANLTSANIANIYTTNIVGFIGSQWTSGTGNIYYAPGVGIGTSLVSSNLTVVGNVVVSNSLSTTNVYLSGALNVQGVSNLWNANIANVYALRYFGDGGLLSNISSGGFVQPLPNLVVSNTVTTTNVVATGNTNTAGFLIQNSPGSAGQVISATGVGGGVQWSTLPQLSGSQGYLLTLPTNYSLGSPFTTGTAAPVIKGFHINLSSFTAEVGQVIPSFSVTNGFLKFNTTGLYQIACILSADQPVSKVGVGTTSASTWPPTVNPTSGYTFVYNVPAGTSPSEMCIIPLNVTDISPYYFLDGFFASGATVLYPTRTITAANSNYGTFVQVVPFGTYIASVSGVASGILSTCSSSNLSSVYSANTYKFSLTTSNGWTVNGVSASAYITPNGNFQVNQPGIYEIDACLNTVGQTPVQFRVGSLASDSLVPNTTTPLYLYTYTPQTTQDPSTSVILPLSIQNISNVYFLEVSFPGTVTGNVALVSQSTYVMFKPIGSFFSPLIFPTNTWSQQGSSIYYSYNVGIGTNAVPASLTVAGNVYASNALTAPNAYLTGSLNVQGTSNLYVANIANIYTTNIVGFIGSQWTTGTANVYYANNVGIGTSFVSSNLTVVGNAFVSNSLRTTNVFTTSLNVQGIANITNIYTTNISGFAVSQWTSGSANIYYANNVGIGTTLVSSNLTVFGNIYASNALTSPFAIITSMNVTGTSNINFSNISTLNVASNIYTPGFTSNSTNTSFNYDTFAIPYLSTSILNVYATANIGNIFVSNVFSPNVITANITTTNLISASFFTANFFTANFISSNFLSTNILSTNLLASNITSANVISTNIFSANFLASNLFITGNIYGANSLITPNVFATTFISTPAFTANVSNMTMAFDTLSVPYLIASATLYYAEDVTRRVPHLIPNAANASSISSWISATANIVSQQGSFWAPSTRPTFSNITTAQSGFAGSVSLPDNRIAFIPQTASNIGIFNTVTGTYTSTIQVGAVPTGFIGGVLAPSGNIVCIPYTNGNICTFNPYTLVFSNAIAHGAPTNSFAGAVLDGLSNVIMVPYSSLNIASYNGSTGLYSNMVQISLTAPQLIGGVLLPTGNIMMIPSGSSNIVQYNPTGAIFSNSVLGSSGFTGGVLSPDGNVVCIPKTGSNVVVVNPSGNPPYTFTNIIAASGYSGGVLMPNGKITCVPNSTTNVGIIDPVTFTFTNITPQTITGSYYGGSVAPDGRIIFCPSSTNNVACLTSTTPVAWSERVLAPYFNKL